MTEEKKKARAKVSDGIKQGIGVFSALKDALEETIEEAKDRGDLSAERAKEVVKDALNRAQEAAGDAKERLDFVTQREFEALRETVEAIAARVTAVEGGVRGPDADSAEDEVAEEESPPA
jgi:polyhydroxyalkanoate synthesis regulator phasin